MAADDPFECVMVVGAREIHFQMTSDYIRELATQHEELQGVFAHGRDVGGDRTGLRLVAVEIALQMMRRDEAHVDPVPFSDTDGMLWVVQPEAIQGIRVHDPELAGEPRPAGFRTARLTHHPEPTEPDRNAVAG